MMAIVTPKTTATPTITRKEQRRLNIIQIFILYFIPAVLSEGCGVTENKKNKIYYIILT